MSNIDYARDESDKRLKALEREIYALYKEAADGLEKTIKEYFDSFRNRDAEMQARLKAGEITEEYYKQWRLNQIARGKRFEALRDKVAERMTNTNEVAAAYINDRTPGIYSLSANYAAYTIEQLYGQTDFTLWNEQAVRRLAVEKPEVMPYYPPERAVERGIDLAWGQKQIKAVVTSSILRGQSLKGMVSDLMERIPTMERASAIRSARTAFTSAENGGRQAAFERAAEMGIQARKRWVATKDKRTRRDHANADGQTVPIDKPFDIGGYAMMFPGDPSGPGKELYNCRCAMRTVKGNDVEAEPRKMRVQTPEYARLYEQQQKEKQKNKQYAKQLEEEKDAEKAKVISQKLKESTKWLNSIEAEMRRTPKNVLVNEMTYSEWERWVESRGA